MIDGDETWASYGAAMGRAHPASRAHGMELTPLALPHDSTELEAWSLRAVPAVPRSELLRVPLLCFDREMDNNGGQVGGEGTAIVRYEELVAATSTGLAVDLVDLNNDRTYTVSVEDLSFSQTVAPDRGEGFGGVITLTGKIL